MFHMLFLLLLLCPSIQDSQMGQAVGEIRL